MEGEGRMRERGGRRDKEVYGINDKSSTRSSRLELSVSAVSHPVSLAASFVLMHTSKATQPRYHLLDDSNAHTPLPTHTKA